MVTGQTVSLLRDGIAAARAGDRPRTQQLLRKVTELEPDNELGWLWLANSTDDPRETLECLRRVLQVNPSNEYAAASLPDALCKAAIAAVKDNDPAQAKAWFAEATELAPHNETAWLWRAGLADSPEEGMEMLQFVLSLNPDNERARQGLAHFESQLRAKWVCPLCQQTTEPPAIAHHCPRCGSIVTLEHPEAFDQLPATNALLLEPIAQQLYATLETDPSPTVAYRLGLIYLNLGHIDECLATFQSAIRMSGLNAAHKAHIVAFIRHRQVLEARRRSAHDTGRRARTSADRPTIIVVHDSPTIRRIAADTLTSANYNVLEAADGESLIQLIGQAGVPSLILLDTHLPGVDGYQVLKVLRANPDTARTPVIFLTAREGFLSKLRASWTGAADHVAIPIDPHRLVTAVNQALVATSPL